MSDCLFCKMVNGEIKPDKVYETERILAFRDIHPQAPVHVLIVPKRHIPTLDELDDGELAGELMLCAKTIAEREGLAADGYRIVINCKRHGGQDVYHLHLHVIGGRRMNWPPG